MKLSQRAGIAVAAVLLSSMGAALAQSPTGPTDFGSISTLNVSIGDTFTTAFPASPNPLYDFTDIYTFTYNGVGGVANGSAISFSNMSMTAVSNLQAALFLIPTASLCANVNCFRTVQSSQGDTTGALNPWVSLPLTSGSATTFGPDALVNGDSYAIEIRGLIGQSGASYGGNLVISTVPEPSTIALLLAGAAGLGLARARRRTH